VTETVIRYEPRGAAKALLESRAPEILIAGPAGTGKSLAMLFKLHLSALAVPGLRALLVRQTHASLTGTTLVTFERSVAADALATGLVRWFGGSARQPAAYKYANGSAILVGGLDRPEKFLSSEFDRIAIDEATETTELALETLISRLRGVAPTYKQIVAACNPAQPTHWIKGRADRGAMQWLHSRHRDNPAYFNLDGTMTDAGADYMSKLDALTGVRRHRLRDGIWAAAEGVIYEEWDPAVHVIDPFPIPEEWPRWWSIDFGYVHAFVCQMWTEDPDGRLIMYRELFHSKRTVDQMAQAILETVTEPNPDFVAPPDGSPVPAYKRRGAWKEPKPRLILADHDSENRATLERELGRTTRAAPKAVLDGIQAVQARLRPGGDGRPRLFLMRGARVTRDVELAEAGAPTSTEEEFPGYIWDVGAGQKPKEAPVKERDDGMDTLRYMVLYRDPKSKPSIRVMK
jgi:hypothetical protein